MRFVGSIVLSGFLFSAGVARAQGAAPPAAPSQSAAPAARPAGVPTDPEGVRGISPSMISLNQGDLAFVARDFDGARTLYQQAIKQNPQVAVAHLRMAQLHLALGELADAAAVLETALRFVGTDLRLKSHAYFLRALVEERGPRPESALASWNGFAAAAQATSTPPDSAAAVDSATPPAAAPAAAGPPDGPNASDAASAEAGVLRDSGAAPGYEGTVAERKRMILAHQQLSQESAQVKARNEKSQSAANAPVQ